MGLGLVAALLLNKEFAWRGLARALVIIPWALPSVVIALMWRWIYDPTTGVLNDLLIYLSVLQTAVPWLADPDKALYAVIATLVWQGFLLHGHDPRRPPGHSAQPVRGGVHRRRQRLAAVPPHHAAGHRADPGDGRPAAHHLGGQFDGRHLRDDGRGPGYATYTLPLYAFIKARQNLDFGYGTSIAVTFTILLGVVVALYIARSMREVEK